jgi:hypothetical protein
LEKKTELNFFLNKKQNQTETGSNDWFWFGSIRFGFLGKKTGSNQVWFGFGSVFSSLARFFSGLGSVQFFRFQAYKTETKSNRSIILKF